MKVPAKKSTTNAGASNVESPINDIRSSEDRLKEQVELVLSVAQRLGADQAEVSVSQNIGLSVSSRMGALETVEFNKDRGFGITVYVGDRKGVATTSDLSPASLEESVNAALKIATYTQGDVCSGLAEKHMMATQLPDLDLYHPWYLTVEQAGELAMECEAYARDLDKRITNSDGATLASQLGCRAYGNSHGFTGSYVSSRHSLSVSVIAKESESMQKDYWYTISRAADDLESGKQVGREAATRALARLGSRRFESGRMPVLFSPQMASGLIASLLSAIMGGALYRNASFLMDSLGSQVAHDSISIIEQPHLPRAMGSAGFDGDGIATYSKAFIERGVVNSYILSTYSARRLQMETTGNASGVHNISVEGELSELDSLLKQMGNGVMVTQLMGQGVNAVTGDYSRGASGFLVQNGELVHAIENFTIASNLKDMFMNLAGLGSDIDERGNIRNGSILVEEMTVVTN